MGKSRDSLLAWRQANPDFMSTQSNTHAAFQCAQLKRHPLTGPTPFLIAVSRVKQLRSYGYFAWWERL